MWKIEEITYLAGIIDGEGTIYLQRLIRNSYINWYPRFQIVNTNVNLMMWIHKTFGGHLYGKDRSNHNKNWKYQYEWCTNRKIIDLLLPKILPYLIVKKEQAELMLEFRKTFVKKYGRSKIPKDIYEHREQIFNKIKNLNKRGYSSLPPCCHITQLPV